MELTERLEKFTKILELLNGENIYLLSIDNGCPILVDLSCGYQLTHNIITWDTYSVEEVANMIITGRNNWKKQENK